MPANNLAKLEHDWIKGYPISKIKDP